MQETLGAGEIGETIPPNDVHVRGLILPVYNTERRHEKVAELSYTGHKCLIAYVGGEYRMGEPGPVGHGSDEEWISKVAY